MAAFAKQAGGGGSQLLLLLTLGVVIIVAAFANIGGATQYIQVAAMMLTCSSLTVERDGLVCGTYSATHMVR